MKTKVSKIIMVLLAVTVITGLVIACVPSETGEQLAYAESYVTISINPEAELVADENGVVIGVYPVNEDAEILLSESTFEGMTIEDAVEEIVEIAEEAGYLDETTEDIEIGVVTADEELTTQIRNRIRERVQTKLNGKGLGNCELKDADMSMYAEAATRTGKSQAEAKMMARIMEIDPTATEDALKTQTMSQLANRYAGLMGNGKVNAALREEFHTQRDALIAGDAARNELLTQIQGLKEQLENAELGETERAEIQTQLEAKNGELETANQALVQEIAALRTQYQAQMTEAHNQQKTMLQTRKQQKQAQGSGNQG